jgi:hypothetical protein
VENQATEEGELNWKAPESAHQHEKAEDSVSKSYANVVREHEKAPHDTRSREHEKAPHDTRSREHEAPRYKGRASMKEVRRIGLQESTIDYHIMSLHDNLHISRNKQQSTTPIFVLERGSSTTQEERGQTGDLMAHGMIRMCISEQSHQEEVSPIILL